MTLAYAEQMRRKELLERGLKRCSRCEIVKSIEEFGKKKRNSDGLRSNCKECDAIYRKKYRSDPENVKRELASSRAWKKRNYEHVLEYARKWAEENPERKKELKTRWHQANKESENAKARERAKIWAKENKERHNACNRKYRARKFDAEGFHTDDQIEMLFMLCENQCLVCGETENLAVDHIQPLNKGGTDWVTNLQVLCKKHNGEKGDHHATDHRPEHIKAWAEEQVKLK